MTQDRDFADPRRFAPGTHAGILLLRLPQQRHVSNFVVAYFSTPQARTWARCFVVATPSRVRVLRPTVAAGNDDDGS